MVKFFKIFFERFIGKNMFISEMRVENDFLGKLYIFVYLFFMVMILINMFLSIFNEFFIEVRFLKKGEYFEVEFVCFIW